ncbi:MAG: peptidase M19 [Anaerolineales bacterium]|nr:peptidase M19 [Anaerolineales bacterium]
MYIVDAHEDVAIDAVVLGRDIRRSALETRRLEQGTDTPERNGLCMVGLPEWLQGSVAVVCATLFTAPADKTHPASPSYHNADEAHALAQTQLDYYHWLSRDQEQVTLIADRTALDAVLRTWENSSPQVGIVPLMEGADPIREPAEVEYWFEQGVRIVGLTWLAGTAYAGGDATQGPLTDAGRELLEAMADVGMILDVSHMSDAAFLEAVDRFEGQVIASHANPRARVPTPRQLSDQMIRCLAERGGVMGIVPYNRFLKPGWTKGDAKDAVTVADVVAAIDHVCQVTGTATLVGIGSDFDGGFGSESTPAEIDTVAHLSRIGAALGEKGYGADDVAAIMGGNWLRVLRTGLPG